MDTLSIDQSAPMPVKRPATVAELCDLVKQARAAKQGIYPIGGRTTLDVGLPPTKPGVALDTTAINRVIDYPARDMTITAQAGITIAALQAELAKEGQWLPVDVPSPEKATLGGALALNQSGPRRYGYGTLRDYVIGISFVTDDGVEVKAGGRVVKNVAGYDLMKLQIGAAGTLGVITQVTLKVKPKPEAAAAVLIACEDAALPGVLDLLHQSPSRPGVVMVTRNTIKTEAELHTDDAFWRVIVAFEEKKASVDWQLATLLAELKSAAVTQVKPMWETKTDELIQGLTDMATTPLCSQRDDWFAFKANIRPSQTAAFCIAARKLRPSMKIQAAGLNGIVWCLAVPGLSLEDAAAMLGSLTELAAEGGGNVVVRRCPIEWKKSLPVWGRPTADRDLMRTVKKTLDPDNVFNPGRLFGDV